jgi:tRNA threonylcarbamoyladenosine biosynthesis protein TsaE
MTTETLRSDSEDTTIALGQDFASRLHIGDVVALYGDLGAGKTEFVKGICSYFEVEQLVTSPTFTIINQYAGSFPDGNVVKLYHVDLYRIDSQEELAEVGFDDCVFAHDAIKLVEWSEKAEHLLPAAHYTVHIATDAQEDNVRIITIGHQVVPHGIEKL